MPARAERERTPGLALASNLKAAAASAEPPPRPAATGRALTRRKRPSAMPGTSALVASAAAVMRLSPASALANGPSTSSARSWPGSSVRWSPSSAKATRLRTSWKPSARRPSTSRVRLNLALAVSRSAVIAKAQRGDRQQDYSAIFCTPEFAALVAGVSGSPSLSFLSMVAMRSSSGFSVRLCCH